MRTPSHYCHVLVPLVAEEREGPLLLPSQLSTQKTAHVYMAHGQGVMRVLLQLWQKAAPHNSCSWLHTCSARVLQVLPLRDPLPELQLPLQPLMPLLPLRPWHSLAVASGSAAHRSTVAMHYASSPPPPRLQQQLRQ